MGLNTEKIQNISVRAITVTKTVTIVTVVIIIIIIFIPQVVLIPGVKNYKLKANITGG